MTGYKKILAAVDLSSESTLVRDKALMLATQHAAELHLVHVLPLIVGYPFDVLAVDIQGLQEEARKHARSTLLELGGKLGIPAERLHSLIGPAAAEIRELAKRLGADLIVMGGHGKHGLELILGSTSSSVTHGVSCDLLILHMPGN